MNWSLNEIESLARKAAHGSGLPWGIAEEAGKATRWLCAAGLSGPEALAALLKQNDRVPYAALRPTDVAGTTWSAPDGLLCPLVTGAALCDQAADLAAGKQVILSGVSHPILLVPYVVMAADMTETQLAIKWASTQFIRGPSGTYLLGHRMRTPVAQEVHISALATPRGRRITRAYRAEITPQVAQVLGRFARRTYAPDTAQSRATGAGAGLSDND